MTKSAARVLVLALLLAPVLGIAVSRPELAPLASGAVSTHGPYGAGECRVCHDGGGAGPGAVTRVVNDLCFDCHDEFRGVVKLKMRHPAPREACTRCHNPHNSRKQKLLL